MHAPDEAEYDLAAISSGVAWNWTLISRSDSVDETMDPFLREAVSHIHPLHYCGRRDDRVDELSRLLPVAFELIELDTDSGREQRIAPHVLPAYLMRAL